jgi:predicted TIM-barrel fold metal-dependent hydrolase
MLIDVHAHFYSEEGGIPDAAERNKNRLLYSGKYGINKVCASVLGSHGVKSPMYLPSLEDMISGNRKMAEFSHAYPGTIYAYCYINPNFGQKALDELVCCIEELGMVGLKLGASTKCTSPIMYPLIEKCIGYDIPILQHIYQRKPGPTPNQNASDALELAEMANRFPKAKIIHAHIGGGGDWEFGLKAAALAKNIWVDISGSGVDSGMLEMAIDMLGPKRILFATDETMATGIAKFEALELTKQQRDMIAYQNALKLFGRRLK